MHCKVLNNNNNNRRFCRGVNSVVPGVKIVSRSQTAIFFKAVLASTAIGVGDYWQWLLCNR